MTELEKLARALCDNQFGEGTYDLLDERPQAHQRSRVVFVLQHLHDNVTEGMVEAMGEAFYGIKDLKPAFQAAIASILKGEPDD